MKIKHAYTKFLLSLISPLLIGALSNTAKAQETIEKKEIAPDSSELLKRGNTWTYAVSVQIPDNVKFKSTLKDKGEKTKGGMIYKFEEIQQSTGLSDIEALKRPAPLINIFIEGKLTKKQILEYRDGSLLYYGTYLHDPKKPDLKKGTISQKPIILYHEQSKVADKWTWSATGLPEFQFRVTTIDTEIEVLGTKYKADKIHMDQIIKGSDKILQSKEIWFAKNIGVIKEREKSYVADGKAIVKTLELKKFENRKLIKE